MFGNFRRLFKKNERNSSKVDYMPFSSELVERLLFAEKEAFLTHVKICNVKKPSCFIKQPRDKKGNVFTLYYTDGDEKEVRPADNAKLRLLFHGIRDKRLLIFEEGQLDTFKDIFWNVDFHWPTEEDVGDIFDCDVVVLFHEEAEAMIFLEDTYR